mgnify:FL=1
MPREKVGTSYFFSLYKMCVLTVINFELLASVIKEVGKPF